MELLLLLIIPFLVWATVGMNILVANGARETIRQEVEEKGGTVIDIDTSWHFMSTTCMDSRLGHFTFEVTYRTTERIETKRKCRVSYFDGVVWADEDSLIECLLP